MQNKLICICLTLVFFIGGISPSVNGQGLDLSARSAIILNCSTGEIVYQKNAYEKRGMASTTKIMTSVIALENGNPDEEIVVRGVDVAVEGTSIGLKAGDSVSLDVLVKGMLLESGNDAANVTAVHLGGSIEGFCVLMNKKAKELGMEDTSFSNPSGLTQENHYSTAYDMALLASYAIKNPQFCKIVSQKSISVSYGSPSYDRVFSNHNRLLQMYEGAFGIKTGFTKASGRCLVSAVNRDGAIYVAVTLNAYNDWEDHCKMYDYAFESAKIVEVSFDESATEIPVVGSKKKTVRTKLSNSLSFWENSKTHYTVKVYHDKFLYSGVKKGDVVGSVAVVDVGGNVITQSNLISCDDAPLNFTPLAQKPSLLDKLIKSIQEFIKGI